METNSFRCITRKTPIWFQNTLNFEIIKEVWTNNKDLKVSLKASRKGKIIPPVGSC